MQVEKEKVYSPLGFLHFLECKVTDQTSTEQKETIHRNKGIQKNIHGVMIRDIAKHCAEGIQDWNSIVIFPSNVAQSNP